MLLLFALCLSLSDVHHLHVFVFSQVSNERPQEEKKFKERVKQSMYQQTKVQRFLSLVSVTFFTTLYCLLSRILFVFQSLSIGKTKICRWFVSE